MKPDQLIAHRLDDVGMITVWEIRDQDEQWMAQCRINHHSRKAEWLYAIGDPLRPFWQSLDSERDAERWLTRHRCHCTWPT